MAKTKTLNIRISEEDYEFLESFEGKKAKIVQAAIDEYRTKIETKKGA